MSRRSGSLLFHWIVASLAAQVVTHGADWIRQGVNTNAPVWGIRDGLQFAIHPGGFGGAEGGPRGLIRIGYPTLTNGAVDLVNFIAVEPIVAGHRGFSELERSSLDSRPGKRFRAEIGAGILTTNQGVEALEVPLEIEPFVFGITPQAPSEILLPSPAP